MDKNEYNLKLQEIEKYVDMEDYAAAASAADGVDWRRVRNVRTLCMISEIYEAVGRYEDSKTLLLRAYRRSPVGRTILYRLVEVCIHLKQFDEAIEYYTEYVHAAPHDNNRYILKYKIYRGRGSSIDEQIEILKEYLDQEYNEKYVYELAKLYREADRIQECLTTCDDLVLWFHSGKYVIRALELKMRYAPLTPKQQEIYDHRFDKEPEYRDESTEESESGAEEAGDDASRVQVGMVDTTLAQSIVEDTERSIGREVSEAAARTSGSVSSNPEATIRRRAAENAVSKLERRLEQTAPVDTEGIRSARQAQAGQADGGESAAGEAETPTGEKELPEADWTPRKVEYKGDDLPADDRDDSSAGTEKNAPKEASEEDQISGESVLQENAAAEAPASGEMTENPPEETSDETESGGSSSEGTAAEPARSVEELQGDVARNISEITSGIGKTADVDPEYAEMDRVIEESKIDQQREHEKEQSRGLFSGKFTVPQPQKKTTAGQVTIDDVLLSMGERGTAVREAAERAKQEKKKTDVQRSGGILSAVDESLLNLGNRSDRKDGEDKAPEEAETRQAVTAEVPDSRDLEEAFASTVSADSPEESTEHTVQETAAAEVPAPSHKAEEQEETSAVAGEGQETGPAEDAGSESENPAEKPAAGSLEAGTAEMAEQEPEASGAVQPENETDDERDALSEAEREREDILSAKTRVIPTGEIAAIYESLSSLKDKKPEQEETAAVKEPESPESEAGETAEGRTETAPVTAGEEEAPTAAGEEEAPTAAGDAEAEADRTAVPVEREMAPEEAVSAENGEKQEAASEAAEGETGQEPAAGTSEGEPGQESAAGTPESETGQGTAAETPENETQPAAAPAGPKVPREVRGLFKGFLEIGNLDSQIAYAIRSALDKGQDRTSRTGNILIFGGHGCGKTTIAMGIAKAIAKERGSRFVKVARIYATDLSRKDIPSTIAKIAGGVLIVEEAGDLSDNVADQLTTAMEFRTDGLILILEDEQKYIHELLMRHPRFTMKFTSQIYIPEFTETDLLNFARNYALSRDYVISDDGKTALMAKLGRIGEEGYVSITAVDDCVNSAIGHSGKLFRRLFAGSKRYDTDGRVILTEKDFK